MFVPLVAFAAGGCRGEEALYPRTADAFAGFDTGGNVGKGGTSGQGGSVGSGGAGNKAGGGGMAGGGAAGQAGGGSGTGGQPPTGHFGDFCQSTNDCMEGSCQGHFCCAAGTNCSGTCMTCDSTAGNICVPVQGQVGDPRGDCAPMATTADMCGIEGTACNGSGACVLWPAGTPCSNASTCSGTDSVSVGSICSGQGVCQPNAPVSCNSFLCESSAGDAGVGGCLTTCGKDKDCVSGGFCGAGSCVGPTPNLAGNGDGEYGTTVGWNAILAGSVTSSTTAHDGAHSILDTGRGAYYQGLGYNIPTGQGQYTVSLWAMQNQYPATADGGTSAPPNGNLQLGIVCGTAMDPEYLQTQVGAVPMPKGTWVNFSFTFDTSNPSVPGVVPECFPDGEHNLTANGLVSSAVVFLEGGSKDTVFPNLYIDDLVVTVPAALIGTQNLDGNPGFESGVNVAWKPNGVGSGSSIVVSGTNAHTGTKSLQMKGRNNPGTGLMYPMMIGAADYSISLWAMQSGTASHTLSLQAAYTCLGDSAVHMDTLATQYSTSTWTNLSSGYAFPPHSTAPSGPPQGCKLTSASLWVTQTDGAGLPCGTGTGQVECPDLFIDDLVIKLTNNPPPL